MAIFNEHVIVNSGRELLGRALAGEGKIIITRAAMGDGKPNKDIKELTSLVSEKIVANVVNIFNDRGTVNLKVQITNSELEAPFKTEEFGIFAKIEGDKQEVLYSYCTAIAADTIPSNHGDVFIEEHTVYIAFSSDAEADIYIKEGVVFLSIETANQNYVRTGLIVEGKLSNGRTSLKENYQYQADNGKWYHNIGGNRSWRAGNGTPDELLVEISYFDICKRLNTKLPQGEVSEEYDTAKKIEDKIKKIIEDKWKIVPKELNSGVDLNNIYESGIYISKLSHNVITNKPDGVDGAFELIVTGISPIDAAYTTQLLKAFNSNNYYVRTQVEYSSIRWTEWQRIANIDDVDKKVSKSGDTMTGQLVIDTSEDSILLKEKGINKCAIGNLYSGSASGIYNHAAGKGIVLHNDGRASIYAGNLNTNSKEVVAAINELNKDKLNKGSVSSDYDTAKKIEDKIKKIIDEKWKMNAKYIGNTNTSTDFNSITESGIYYSGYNNLYINGFLESGQRNYGEFKLIVLGENTERPILKTQIVIERDTNNIHLRSCTAWQAPWTWGPWEKLAKSKEVLSKAGDTTTGDLIIGDGKVLLCSYNYGIKHKKGDGNSIYSLLITNDQRLHLGYNNSIPITLDASDVKIQNNTIWHKGNFNPDDKANKNHTHDDRYYTESEINEKFKNFCPFPINSLYISLGNENPSSLWLGTTWQKQENRFLLGAGSSYNLGATGGNANISLGINNIPRHRHKVDSTSASIAAHSHPATVYWGDGWNDDHPNGNTFSTAGAGCTNTNTAWTGNGGGGATGSFAPYTDYQGNGSAFSIMPPYIAVNIWKRTS